MKIGICAVFFLSFLIGCAPVGGTLAKKVPMQIEAFPSQGNLSNASESQELDPETERIITSYGSTIRKYSANYGFDWRFILAVMKQESRFAPHAESHRGASGFMQMMPRTSAEVARALRIEDMARPKNNIRGGIYYLSRLCRLFEQSEESDRLKLALAAYNAGLSRVQDAQELAQYLDADPVQWSSVKDALPFLSKRYYTLHQNVWQQEKPKSGWFGNSRETVAYVESIMSYYDEYRTVLN